MGRRVQPRRNRRLGVLVALLTLVAVTAGCGGDDEPDDEVSGPTTTFDVEVDDTTTTPVETTTTTAPSEADRFRQLAGDLMTARNDLYQNPPADPAAALAEVIDPQCDCFQAELDAIADLAARGVRVSGPPAMPIGARFGTFHPESGSALLHLALDRSSRQLLAADGSVVEELSGGDPLGVAVGLIDQQGKWLIYILAVLQVDNQFIDGLVAEGLP